MANASVVVFHHILVFGRSTLTSKYFHPKSLIQRSILSTNFSCVRMSSGSATTPTQGEDRKAVDPPNMRSTIIKTAAGANSAISSKDVQIIPTVARPSVICKVQNSVINPVPVSTLVPTIINEIQVAAKEVKVEGVADSSKAQRNEETKESSPTNEKSNSNSNDEAYLRIKKRKVVLLLSYSGTGYFGMQRNPGLKTIEDDLFKAMLKNNYMDEEAYNRPQTINFQRSSRTDKNVSAARQIVSMKLPENVCIDKINEHLPPQIRVFGMKRVTKGFDSKNNCDARTYSYMLPTFAFVPIDDLVTESYRVNPEILELVRAKLEKYVGRKNYHNFTSRKKPGDPSAQRHILSFTCSEPFIQDGLEYVILRVKGQSFMMHQIRKMIGLVIAIVRGFASDDVMDKAFTMEKIDIPRAPGLGLLLDKVHYERYDQRFGKDGYHECLTWDDIGDTVDEFCKKHIYPTVTKTENEEKSMLHWLSTLPYHTYDVRGHEALDEDVAVADGEPTSRSEIGRAFLAVGRAKKNRNADTNEEDDIGFDDDEDDDEIPKPKKLKQNV